MPVAFRNEEQISVDTDRKLAEFVAQYRYDPLGFVENMFPWGQAKTPLANKKGPEPWQRKFLIALGKHCVDNSIRSQMACDMEVWRSAVASGHGVGKSALVAWLILWAMSTRPDVRGVVTANTGDQLENKTWPELAKWHTLILNKHWFGTTATSIFFKAYPEERRKNYMINAQTVSPEKTEAFAGLHNEGNAIIIIFDEASAIDAKVWEVAVGATTDGECFFITFGNPTRPDGEFHDCFGKNAEVYRYLDHVDSRSVSHTNKTAIADIMRLYPDVNGQPSDEVKVRVLGQFPSQAFDGYFGEYEIQEGVTRDVFPDNGAALIMGIDVARYGDDRSVVFFRRGRDARSIPVFKFPSMSTVELAKRCRELQLKYKPDAIVVESTGPGAGVIDTLRSWNIKVLECHPGAASSDVVYANARMENHAKLKEWLVMNGGAIPQDPDLIRSMQKIRYVLDNQGGKQQMEPKKDMKSRGLPSPDELDALSLTFYVNPARRNDRARALSGGMNLNRAVMDYDVMGA